MNLTEAYEIMHVKINARATIKRLRGALLIPETTTFEKVAIRQIIETEKKRFREAYSKSAEAYLLIEEAEDFNAQQLV